MSFHCSAHNNGHEIIQTIRPASLEHKLKYWQFWQLTFSSEQKMKSRGLKRTIERKKAIDYYFGPIVAKNTLKMLFLQLK